MKFTLRRPTLCEYLLGLLLAGPFALIVVTVVVGLPPFVCMMVDWPARSPVQLSDTSQSIDRHLKPGKVCSGPGQCKDAYLFTGSITTDTFNEVSRVLADHSKTRTLCLRSTGGSTKSAGALSDWLFERGYGTCLPQVKGESAICASACTQIFLGGRNRTASSNVVFSIHGSSFPALVESAPDAITGEAGTPRGGSGKCKSASILANHVLSWSDRYIFSSFWSQNSDLSRLRDMSWPIPGHTFRQLSLRQLQDFGVSIVGPAIEYEWVDTKP